MDLPNSEIIDVLNCVRSERSIPVLRETLTWLPSWDEGDVIAVKSAFAMSKIDSAEAVEALRESASSTSLLVRAAAAKALSWHQLYVK
jgi:HEAT repeat protein